MMELICKFLGHIFIEDAYFNKSKISSGHCKRCGKDMEIKK
jgi:hypothetical protein